METPPIFEIRESIIDGLVDAFAEKEGMNSEDIMSDIIVFAPYEGNDSANPDYIEQVAELIGVSNEEMIEYAIKKAKEHLK
ncbi:MAG: hypothetical protein HYT15_04040 [Candidatus Magasanikbacteria bacterium]|nr:hypothetical protein [Candidatus Magasanikbacteria bacterium]